MLKDIKQWLADPKRTYASGINLFNQWATPVLRKKYSEFLNSPDPLKVEPFSQNYNILINKLTDIAHAMAVNPSVFEVMAQAQTVFISQQETRQEVQQIVRLSSERDELVEKLSKVQEDNKQLKQLNDSFAQKMAKSTNLNSQIGVLRNKLHTLNTTEMDPALTDKVTELDSAIGKLNIDIEGAKADPEKSKEVKALEKQVKELTKEQFGLQNKIDAIQGQAHIDADNLTAQIRVLETENRELEIEVDDLNTQINDLEDSLELTQEELEAKETELSAKDSEIDGLKKTLEGKKIQFITADQLPDELKPKYKRIQEIVPLMGAVHAEMRVEGLTDLQRKIKAGELCSLNDERLSLWDDINEYLATGELQLEADSEPEYSADPLIRGMQFSKRIHRLKENIARNEKSAKAHEEAGKLNLAVTARANIAKYTAELEEIQGELNDKK